MTFAFGPFHLDEAGRVLRLDDREVALQPRVFNLLVHLVRNRERVVSKEELFDTLWPNVTVTEASLQRAISILRTALKEGGMENAIRSFPRVGYRFFGEQEDVVPSVSRRWGNLRQEIKFCAADDGTRLAYAALGDGSCLVKAANWLSHLEYEWESPIWTHVFRALSSGRKLVRYDARGNGLSDWHVSDFSFEAFVSDLEAVVNASGAQRFALLGLSQGCAVSVAYAVRNPERVSHMVLLGGFARGWCKRGSPAVESQMAALETLMRQGWGRSNAAFRQLFTTLLIPDATAEEINAFNELQRRTASPENAARILNAVNLFDVEDLLPQVRVPTLVMHTRYDAVQPFEEGRKLAAKIPGARFVPLEGRNHLLLSHDPAWKRFFSELNAFLDTSAAETRSG
jgi:pimeloyl-ACP methyl ester carboxylesterase/DNA-binding winged helix-turn-helix (wHTH) protein